VRFATVVALVSLVVGSYLKVMQRNRINNKNKGFDGGQYARSEEELYKKAMELLNKCKIEVRP
jgi:hypothetical protein